MSRIVRKPTKWHVRPAKTQISLGIRPVWSEYSLCVLRLAKDHSFLQSDSEESDQTRRMPRLIWVFAGRTCHFVGFVTMQLKYIWYVSHQVQLHTDLERKLPWGILDMVDKCEQKHYPNKCSAHLNKVTTNVKKSSGAHTLAANICAVFCVITYIKTFLDITWHNQRPIGHNAHLIVQLWRLYSAKIL